MSANTTLLQSPDVDILISCSKAVPIDIKTRDGIFISSQHCAQGGRGPGCVQVDTAIFRTSC